MTLCCRGAWCASSSLPWDNDHVESLWTAAWGCQEVHVQAGGALVSCREGPDLRLGWPVRVRNTTWPAACTGPFPLRRRAARALTGQITMKSRTSALRQLMGPRAAILLHHASTSPSPGSATFLSADRTRTLHGAYRVHHPACRLLTSRMSGPQGRTRGKAGLSRIDADLMSPRRVGGCLPGMELRERRVIGSNKPCAVMAHRSGDGNDYK